MSQNFDKVKEVLYKFHITYNDPSINDGFVRGDNVVLEFDDMITALIDFTDKNPTVEILGVLKSIIEK